MESGEPSLQQILEDQTLDFIVQKILITIMTLVHISDIMAQTKDHIWYGVKIVSVHQIYHNDLFQLFNL